MNKGVEILLARMESNPEEFVAEAQYGITKWGALLQEYRSYLNKEDLDAFDAKHKETVFVAMQNRFTEKVMEELLDPKSESNPYLAKSAIRLAGATPGGFTLMPNGAPPAWANTSASTGTVTLPAGSITLGNTTLQEEELKKILEQHDLGLKHKKLIAETKHKTLFGRLFTP